MHHRNLEHTLQFEKQTENQIISVFGFRVCALAYRLNTIVLHFRLKRITPRFLLSRLQGSHALLLNRAIGCYSLVYISSKHLLLVFFSYTDSCFLNVFKVSFPQKSSCSLCFNGFRSILLHLAKRFSFHSLDLAGFRPRHSALELHKWTLSRFMENCELRFHRQ